MGRARVRRKDAQGRRCPLRRGGAGGGRARMEHFKTHAQSERRSHEYSRPPMLKRWKMHWYSSKH